jgi:predicted Fe-Mo cluster-binding NifX family protein
MALIYGYNLKIHEVKNDFYVAVCSSSKTQLEEINLYAEFIFILHIEEYKLTSKVLIKNPTHNGEARPTSVLPNLLQEHEVNYFITDKIGIGLKNTLISKGIYPILKDNITFEEITDLFK